MVSSPSRRYISEGSSLLRWITNNNECLRAVLLASLTVAEIRQAASPAATRSSWQRRNKQTSEPAKRKGKKKNLLHTCRKLSFFSSNHHNHPLPLPPLFKFLFTSANPLFSEEIRNFTIVLFGSSQTPAALGTVDWLMNLFLSFGRNKYLTDCARHFVRSRLQVTSLHLRILFTNSSSSFRYSLRSAR